MDGRAYLLKYLEALGTTRVEQAKALGIPYPTLASVCNGNRGISKAMAQRLAIASGGKLDPNKLVWVSEQKAA